MFMLNELLIKDLSDKVDTNTADIQELKNNDFIKIFDGSTSAGNKSTINTTWKEIGQFKYMIIELYKQNVNSRSYAIIPYFLFSNGNNLYDGRRTTNVYGYFNDVGGFKTIHLIPNTDITSNSIKFDTYGDSNIVAIYICK